MVQIVAKLSFSREIKSERAAKIVPHQQLFNIARGGFTGVDQFYVFAYSLLYHRSQYRIMCAAQHERIDPSGPDTSKIFTRNSPRDIRFRPALFREGDKERAGLRDDLYGIL